MSNEKIGEIIGGTTEAIKADLVLVGDVNDLMKQLVSSKKGLDVSSLSEMDGKTRVDMLRKLTAYTSQKTELIDDFIGKTIYLVGAFISPAQVKLEKPKVDEISGELIEYQATERTVIKFYKTEAEANSRKTEPFTVGFSSIAAASFFKTFIFPAFGLGDFEYSIPLEVTSGTCKAGRTYNFKVV